jgi:hypothetical protein
VADERGIPLVTEEFGIFSQRFGVVIFHLAKPSQFPSFITSKLTTISALDVPKDRLI